MWMKVCCIENLPFMIGKVSGTRRHENVFVNLHLWGIPCLSFFETPSFSRVKLWYKNSENKIKHKPPPSKMILETNNYYLALHTSNKLINVHTIK